MEWIKFADKKPEEGQTVLMLCEYPWVSCEKLTLDLLEYHSGEGYCTGDIVYWIPIPAAPVEVVLYD